VPEIPSLPSLALLGKMKTFDEVLRWAQNQYGEGGGRMRDPGDLRAQALYSAMEGRPVKMHDRWKAYVFVRLPETSTTFGGYKTVCIVKVTVSWPERDILSILYEP